MIEQIDEVRMWAQDKRSAAENHVDRDTGMGGVSYRGEIPCSVLTHAIEHSPGVAAL